MTGIIALVISRLHIDPFVNRHAADRFCVYNDRLMDTLPSIFKS